MHGSLPIFSYNTGHHHTSVNQCALAYRNPVGQLQGFTCILRKGKFVGGLTLLACVCHGWFPALAPACFYWPTIASLCNTTQRKVPVLLPLPPHLPVCSPGNTKGDNGHILSSFVLRAAKPCAMRLAAARGSMARPSFATNHQHGARHKAAVRSVPELKHLLIHITQSVIYLTSYLVCNSSRVFLSAQAPHLSGSRRHSLSQCAMPFCYGTSHERFGYRLHRFLRREYAEEPSARHVLESTQQSFGCVNSGCLGR